MGRLDKDLWILYQEVDAAEHPLSIRSLYVLLVVVLSAWVLGAALRLSGCVNRAGRTGFGSLAELSITVVFLLESPVDVTQVA